MKKAIITAIIILAVLTVTGVFALNRASGGSSAKKSGEQKPVIPAETQKLLDDDSEKRTSREVLDEIKNVGADHNADDGDTENKTREKHEISRENYEKCGYDTGTYIIRYSDGSSEIVEGGE